MLHTKYQGSRSFGFRQEDFVMLFPINYVKHVTLGWGHFWPKTRYFNKHGRGPLICFQSLSEPRFSFLNSFKLNLEERHLACGFKCTPRN